MELVTVCVGCGKRLRLPGALQGKRVQCPQCAALFVAEATATTLPRDDGRTAPPLDVAHAVQTDFSPHPAEKRQATTAVPASADFPPVHFTARVVQDADQALKGQLQGVWTPDGLQLRRGQETALTVPVGSPAGHVRGGRLTIQLPGRNLELAIAASLATCNERLAIDLVDYLNGMRDAPDPRGYTLPWYLLAACVLPMGIPVASLGGGIWGAVGGGLCGLCLLLARRERHSPAVRLVQVLLLSALGYALFGAAVGGLLALQRAAQQRQAALPPPRNAVIAPRVPSAPPPPPAVPAVPGQRWAHANGRALPAFAPDAQTLGVFSYDGVLQLWDVETGTERFKHSFPLRGGVSSLFPPLFSPDSRLVVAWDSHGTIDVRDRRGNVTLRLPPDVEGFRTARGAFRPDGKLLAICMLGHVQFWQLPEGSAPAALAPVASTPEMVYTSVQFTPDGRTLVTGGYDKFGMRADQVWDLATAGQTGTVSGWQQELRHDEVRYNSLDLSPDGRLALRWTERTAEVLDWAARRSMCLVRAEAEAFTDVIFAADGRQLLSVNRGGQVERWDLATARRTGSFTIPNVERDRTARLAVSADGKLLAAATTGVIRVCDVEAAFAR